MPGRHQLSRRTGTRWPNHIGTREITGGEAMVIAAAPVMSGETLFHLSLDLLAITRTDDAPDQPGEIGWYVVFHPFDWQGSGGATLTLNTITLDAWFGNAISNAQTTTTKDWPDPNPGGDAQYLAAQTLGIQTDEIMFRREVLTRPMPPVWVDSQSLASPENQFARHMDEHRTILRKRFRFDQPGFIFVGAIKHILAAQTDFGVAELDTQLSMLEMAQAIMYPLENDVLANADASKVQELLYGGDSYVEADSFKAADTRCYAKAKFGFSTPWPMR